MVAVFGSDWPDGAVIDCRLRRWSFQAEVWRWSKDDQHALRVELEQIPLPQVEYGDGLPVGALWDLPQIIHASEVVFMSFALRRGLLTPEFFQQPDRLIEPIRAPRCLTQEPRPVAPVQSQRRGFLSWLLPHHS